MNTESNPADDPLEVLLRKNSAHLADNGFSARVLAALPPPPPMKQARPSRRMIACGLGTLTGLRWAFATSGLPHTRDLMSFGSQLTTSTESVVISLSAPSVLFVGTLILVSLAFAFHRELISKLD